MPQFQQLTHTSPVQSLNSPQAVYNWTLWLSSLPNTSQSMQTLVDYGASTATSGSVFPTVLPTQPAVVENPPQTIVEPSSPVGESPPTAWTHYNQSRRDIYNAFNGAICKYKGMWVYISSSSYYSEEDILYIHRLADANSRDYSIVKCREALLSDFDLNPTDFSWGYLNEARPVHLSYQHRTPVGNQRVGIRVNDFQTAQNSLWHYRSQAFVDMLDNKYPSFESVWNELTSTSSGMAMKAFHKDYALYRNAMRLVTLMRRGVQVGECVLGKNATPDDIVVYPAYDYLLKQVKQATGLTNIKVFEEA